MGRPNSRAAAVIIKNHKILLMHRINNANEYWVFLGGGVEDGETPEQTVVREVMEEASINIKVDRLLYTHIYSGIGHKHYYYLCDYISGIPKLGNYNEMESIINEGQTYEPAWVPIDKLPKLLLYPLEVRDWLIEDYKSNFKNTHRIAEMDTKDLRQEL